MTQRERTLAMAVGGLLVFLVIYWGFNKYRSAVEDREKQIATLDSQQLGLMKKRFDGARAEGQMGEYFVRSLPGNVERARSEYSKWLLQMVQASNLKNANVDPSTSLPVADLYDKHSFEVKGHGEFQSILDLLHAFYAKDYLHRIRKFSLKPRREGGFDMDFTADAIGLKQAPLDSSEPGVQSWRVDSDVAAYHEPILNRNLFEPPNQGPKFTGKKSVEAYVNKSTPVPLTFKDPEGHRLNYELIEAPEDVVKLDARSGTLKIMSRDKGEIKVLVRATDSGFPNRFVDQSVVINIVDEPPPPKRAPPALKFDDAKQTVLTGLVQGGDDWRAWMNVRTRGTTLKLRVDDEFEIGSVSGKIIQITSKFVEIEIDGKPFKLKLKENLAEAAKEVSKDEEKAEADQVETNAEESATASDA